MVLYSGKSEIEFTPNDTPEFLEFIQSTFDANDIEKWVSGIVNNRKIWKENFAEVSTFIPEVAKDVTNILTKGMN